MLTTMLLLQVGFLPFSTRAFTGHFPVPACSCSAGIQQELSRLSGNKISQVALFLPIKCFPQPAEAAVTGSSVLWLLQLGEDAWDAPALFCSIRVSWSGGGNGSGIPIK